MTLRGRQSGVDLKPPQAAVDKSDSGERCESPPGDSTKATSEEGPFLAQSRRSPISRAAHSLALSRLFRCGSRHERKLRSYRNDATRIQFAVALIVVALDVLKIDSRCDALDPEQGAHIVRKARIVGNPPDVAFEMTDIDGIEPDQRREQPPVGFRDFSAR
jgi:hypothetical protein